MISIGDILFDYYEVIDIRRGGMGIIYVAQDLFAKKNNEKIAHNLLQKAGGIHPEGWNAPFLTGQDRKDLTKYIQEGLTQQADKLIKEIVVALKTFQDRYLNNPLGVGRFRREAEIWVNLAEHPNIVKAKLVLLDSGRPYIILEFIDGNELRSHLYSAPFPQDKVLDYAEQFCNGMIFAQKQGLLSHGDIKPENILIDPDNVLKITDFGLAQALINGAPELINTDENIVGTLLYMAPENFRKSPCIDQRSDIYSFGIILHEMFTGNLPFDIPRSATTQEIIKYVMDWHINKNFSAEHIKTKQPKMIVDIVNKCLSKNPENRFCNFEQLKNAINQTCEMLEINISKESAFKQSSTIDWEKMEEEKKKLQEELSQGSSYGGISFYDCYTRGKSLLELGRCQQAICWLNKVLEPEFTNKAELKDPTCRSEYGKSLFLKGVCLQHLSSHQEALDCFDQLLGTRIYDDNIINSYIGHNVSLVYNDNIPIAPYGKDSKIVWFHMAISFFILNKIDESICALEKSMEIDPNFLEAKSLYLKCKSLMAK